MSKLRVFISHGTRTPQEQAIRDQLVSAVEGAGCEVLMDRITLAAGARWRPEIYSWLMLAHAAVVLLTESAKRSRWVPREAMVMRWRKELDPDFSLHLVLAPEFGVADLNKGAYADLGLNDINAVSSNDLTSLIQKLAAQKSLPDDIIHRRIREILLPVYNQLDESRRAEAAKCMAFNLSSWAGQFAELDMFAVQLAHYGLREDPPRGATAPDFPGVKALTKITSGLDENRRKDLLNVLAPGWVDCAAAARLVAEASQPVRQVLVLTAANAHAAEHYVARSWSQKWEVAPRCLRLVEPKPESKPTRIEELRAALFDTVRPFLPSGLNDDSDVAWELAEKKKEMTPYFIYVTEKDSPSVTLNDLISLQQDQPNPVFLWLCRKREGLPTQCRLLRPILRPSMEIAGLRGFSKAYTLLKL